ncbi:twin-arginine translocation protein, TatA/E family [Deferribacter desulfuricans SSM1]|uniref:Sec-independent protein translocase protein TatA n=1 Tax=Deferribacter desulfuricans (strain DSM 14783 / JCM 11476 / NBRC 101012 / SSM1) TaxID=639282 RepID=D3PCY6_DEFDS|nr:twin-arginine translocase TatA/TatE family subunit [Deferribacter desulfuricans]BAI80459.1 twin-arginine translocation protein, TatA/E family [Deferribacter desulfuricans SSM1]
MFGLGTQELLIILVIVLVIFGAGKLPQIGEGLGKAIKNFKKAANDAENAVDITPEEPNKQVESKSEDKKDA